MDQNFTTQRVNASRSLIRGYYRYASIVNNNKPVISAYKMINLQGIYLVTLDREKLIDTLASKIVNM